MNLDSMISDNPQETPAARRSEQRFCWLFVGLAVVLCMPMILLDKLPPHDVSERYAPMVRELAAGNWDRAFMPRIQPLLVILSALPARLGLHPFTALKLTSVLLFALGVFPIFHLSKRIFNPSVARWTVFAYVFCAKLMQYAGDGLRETGKILFLLTALYGLFEFGRSQHKWRCAAWIGLGAAGMALVRGEPMFYAALALVLLLGMDTVLRRDNRFRLQVPLRALAALGIFLLLTGPWIYYQFRLIGYPVTDFRQAVIIYRVSRHFGIPLPPPRVTNLEDKFERMRLKDAAE